MAKTLHQITISQTTTDIIQPIKSQHLKHFKMPHENRMTKGTSNYHEAQHHQSAGQPMVDVYRYHGDAYYGYMYELDGGQRVAMIAGKIPNAPSSMGHGSVPSVNVNVNVDANRGQTTTPKAASKAAPKTAPKTASVNDKPADDKCHKCNKSGRYIHRG
jgi:hypothetical protein